MSDVSVSFCFPELEYCIQAVATGEPKSGIDNYGRNPGTGEAATGRFGPILIRDSKRNAYSYRGMVSGTKKLLYVFPG